MEPMATEYTMGEGAVTPVDVIVSSMSWAVSPPVMRCMEGWDLSGVVSKVKVAEGETTPPLDPWRPVRETETVPLPCALTTISRMSMLRFFSTGGRIGYEVQVKESVGASSEYPSSITVPEGTA